MRVWVVAVSLLAVVATGCSGGTEVATAPPSPSALATLTPSPTPSPTPLADPLTGLELLSGPVVAVKIDNAPLARRYQRGLKQASVIYQELVEGGSTRFMAMFESARATAEVGPIRSARETDLEILRAYGAASLAFSGAQPGVQRLVRSAAAAGRVRDASYDVVPSLYRLGERRRDARNFFAVPSRLGKRIGGSEPRNIGWRFGTAPAGQVATAATVRFSSNTKMSLRYRQSTGTWTISQGSHVVPFSPTNIIIQTVVVKASRFSDVNGQNSPNSVTTGAGKVTVLRDGVAISGTWSRARYGPTSLIQDDGSALLLKPGPSWVMLLPTVGSVAFS